MSDLENVREGIGSSVFSEVTNYEILDTGYVKGVLFSGQSTNYLGTGLNITGKWFTYASEKDRFWCNLICAQSDHSDYLYDDDFMKMIYSIRPIDDEPETFEETATHETISETETLGREVSMPIMNGTSVNEAVKRAGDFGLTELYDADFGHGTHCKSLSDSAGGLTLDIIYSTVSKEILSGSIVTFNVLSSENDQKDFIKGIASVLCPRADINAVTSWVNSNVGNVIETEINEEIYEMALGPTGNLLYYAGIRNWEEWDLAQ